jgi:hypothetical protein
MRALGLEEFSQVHDIPTLSLRGAEQACPEEKRSDDVEEAVAW